MTVERTVPPFSRQRGGPEGPTAFYPRHFDTDALAAPPGQPGQPPPTGPPRGEVTTRPPPCHPPANPEEGNRRC